MKIRRARGCEEFTQSVTSVRLVYKSWRVSPIASIQTASLIAFHPDPVLRIQISGNSNHNGNSFQSSCFGTVRVQFILPRNVNVLTHTVFSNFALALPEPGYGSSTSKPCFSFTTYVPATGVCKF